MFVYKQETMFAKMFVLLLLFCLHVKQCKRFENNKKKLKKLNECDFPEEKSIKTTSFVYVAAEKLLAQFARWRCGRDRVWEVDGGRILADS